MPAKPKKAKTKPAKAAPKRVAKPARAPNSAASPPPDNKANYLKFIAEVMNGGNFSVAATYLAPDVRTHNSFPGQEPGIDGYVAALKAFHGAFPDMHANVTHLVAEGDMIAGRFEVTGTHRGAFLGMPASGRKMHYEEFAMVRMADGKIAEHWSVADAIAIMQQLQTSDIA